MIINNVSSGAYSPNRSSLPFNRSVESHSLEKSVARQQKNTHTRVAAVASNPLCKIPQLNFKYLYIPKFY